jgi:hypothetical protein
LLALNFCHIIAELLSSGSITLLSAPGYGTRSARAFRKSWVVRMVGRPGYFSITDAAQSRQEFGGLNRRPTLRKR